MHDQPSTVVLYEHGRSMFCELDFIETDLCNSCELMVSLVLNCIVTMLYEFLSGCHSCNWYLSHVGDLFGLAISRNPWTV